jgi:RNA polymerase sigma-70 factor (ECF subfamily)
MGVALQPEVEKELIRKCLAGDARFYEPLVRAYEGPAMRVAVGMMGNPDDAYDAVQEAFVKVFNNLGKFDLKRAFGPWFFQILRNQCRDQLRSRQARGRLETVDERLELRPADEESSPERARQRTAAREVLWKGLERIGEEHREIIVLKELEGFRYNEIAEIVGIPEGTVASRLFHARRALKEALEAMGITYP